MKKTIALVAPDPLAGASYTREIESLFGDYADVKGYSVRDGSATGKLPRADLFVNLTETMAREAIAQLNALGVNHLKFIPYHPGAQLRDEDIDMIFTPGETRYIPEIDKPVIDCGQRPCTYSMMIEIAMRLGLEHLLETEPFLNYEKSVASKHYSFDLLYTRARRQENLEEKVEDGSFRRDLYYRLNALTVVLPPLRERGQDLFQLLEHFKQELGGRFQLADETREFLANYPWPGNIRELHNAAEYFNYIGKPVIEMTDLPPTMSKMLEENAVFSRKKNQQDENRADEQTIGRGGNRLLNQPDLIRMN